MISQKELLKALIPLLQKEGKQYAKYRPIHAKPAEEGEPIMTVTADGPETINTADEDDIIVKNTTYAGEQYLMSEEKFKQRYRWLRDLPNGWAEYQPIGKILAIELTDRILQKLGQPTEFQFEASWGEAMVAKKGDYLAVPLDLRQTYRIARQEFFETYKLDEA
ncbi:MAG: hypothetical protein SFU99_15475 [Saprospiraceae bacterium]|nr:hypothetical protein [Saprospiraceae bacterium]